jgi:hypothetical protein
LRYTQSRFCLVQTGFFVLTLLPNLNIYSHEHFWQ